MLHGRKLKEEEEEGGAGEAKGSDVEMACVRAAERRRCLLNASRARDPRALAARSPKKASLAARHPRARHGIEPAAPPVVPCEVTVRASDAAAAGGTARARACDGQCVMIAT